MKRILTLLICLVLVGCNASTKPSMKLSKTKRVPDLPPAKEYSIIGYDQNKIIIGSTNRTGNQFDVIIHHNELYIYDVKSNTIDEIIDLSGETFIVDFMIMETGYIYTYRKSVADGLVFGYELKVGDSTKGASYAHHDLSKVPRLFRRGNDVNLIKEVNEDHEPVVIIDTFKEGVRMELFRHEGSLLSATLYPSDKGHLFVKYDGNESTIIEANEQGFIKVLSTQGEVFDIFSFSNSLFFSVYREGDIIVLDEQSEVTSFDNEGCCFLALNDSMFISKKSGPILTLNYKEDLELVKLDIEVPDLKEGDYHMFRVDEKTVLLVSSGFEFVQYQTLSVK